MCPWRTFLYSLPHPDISLIFWGLFFKLLFIITVEWLLLLLLSDFSYASKTFIYGLVLLTGPYICPAHMPSSPTFLIYPADMSGSPAFLIWPAYLPLPLPCSPAFLTSPSHLSCWHVLLTWPTHLSPSPALLTAPPCLLWPTNSILFSSANTSLSQC